MSTNRKWKKFKRDPKLFFSDMYQKRRKYFLKYLPKKAYKMQQNFTVVSAVYGVEKYLTDYFESLVNQTIGFESHIQLILVDDDSPDQSAQIIQEWVKKYPNNITYVHKENGGQASARNLGMDFVKTEWVTFIDPDDFVSLDFFEEIAKVIDNNKKEVGLINCNLIFYREKMDQYSDSHALKYKFSKGITYCLGENLEKNIIMSASSSIFSSKIISDNNLFFHKKVKPTFEDARFISEYLYTITSLKVAFLPNAKYFYRKRAEVSSTVDTSWCDKRKYLDIFKYGYLFILDFYYEKQGRIPDFIQRQVLYDLAWYCKHLLNNPSPLNILTIDEKLAFYNNVNAVFSHIDKKIILDFELAGIWFFYKVAMLGSFKNDHDIRQIVYIERFDKEKKEILISYNCCNQSNITILFDEKDTIPKYKKQKGHTFGDQYFITTYKMWVKVPGDFNKFQIKIGGSISRISIGGKTFTYLHKQDLLNNLNKLIPQNIQKHWIIMDRNVQADDNAEHLYRHIQRNHPDQEIYFVLSKKSHDWKRLKQDKFNLLSFGSSEHKNFLKSASKIISSHAEKYIHNYLPDDFMLKQKFVFLQHGVIKDDLSNWLNTKPNIDLMITSTQAEKDSIALNDNYYLTQKQVVLTGLPRHDLLLKKQKNVETKDKVILIMPTWRKYILSSTISQHSFIREKNATFMSTSYAIHWKSFLHSKELKEFADRNIKIIFAPHKNIEPYLDDFCVPIYIEKWESHDCSIQDLFLKSTIMITDYSSVAFDMAFLEKQVIYYQFDEDLFFSGNHTYSKGYFDYRRDGFGPVVINENDLVKTIQQIANNNFTIEEPYLSRIKSVYPYRDGKNCERVFQAIKSLDAPVTEDITNLTILTDFAFRACYKQEWNIAIERAKQLFLQGNEQQKNIAQLILAEASYNLYNTVLFFDFVNIRINEIKDNKTRAFLFMTLEKWEDAYQCWNSISKKLEHDLFYQLICCQHLDNKYATMIHHSYLQNFSKNKQEAYVLNALVFMAQHKHEKALEQFNLLFNGNVSVFFLKKYQPQLLLASIYRNIGKYGECSKQLLAFEKHTKNSVACRIQIAKLALKNTNHSKAISQLKAAFSEDYKIMPPSILIDYIQALTMSLNKNLRDFNDKI